MGKGKKEDGGMGCEGGGRKNRHEREVGNSERSVHAARVSKLGSCSPASLAPSSMPAGAGGRGSASGNSIKTMTEQRGAGKKICSMAAR